MAEEAPEHDLCARVPPALALRVFALLPADARARAACVRRGWRDALATSSAWLHLNLSETSGVAVKVNCAVFEAAAARAGGQLVTLDVSGARGAICDKALVAVVKQNAVALRELRAIDFHKDGGNPMLLPQDVGRCAALTRALLAAAPHLRVLEADMTTLMANAGSVLRRQEPFERLSVATLSVVNRGSVPADTSPPALLDLCDAMAQNVSLRGLKLACVPLSTPEVFDAFVDAAAPKLTKLSFFVCGLAPACEQALVRLLRSTTLTDLCIHERSGAPLIDAAAAPAVADALRANRTLTHLSLQCIKLWDDMDAASAILGALTAHSTLRILDLCLNIIWDNVDGADATVRKQAGTLLGALIAADACALKALDISSCGLGDAAGHGASAGRAGEEHPSVLPDVRQQLHDARVCAQPPAAGGEAQHVADGPVGAVNRRVQHAGGLPVDARGRGVCCARGRGGAHRSPSRCAAAIIRQAPQPPGAPQPLALIWLSRRPTEDTSMHARSHELPLCQKNTPASRSYVTVASCCCSESLHLHGLPRAGVKNVEAGEQTLSMAAARRLRPRPQRPQKRPDHSGRYTGSPCLSCARTAPSHRSRGAGTSRTAAAMAGSQWLLQS
jgi:hypothetical protein